MKKLLLFMLIGLFAGINIGNAQITDLKEKLTSGKWLNHSDGYVASPIADEKSENKRVVKRYKFLSFKENGIFEMDSAKQRYSGKWQVVGN